MNRKQSMLPPVRRIDHIVVEAREPAVVLDSIRSALALTVAWPVQRARHGYESGGLFAGNVNLEVIRFDNPRDPSAEPRYWGFALEPEGEIGSAVTELRRRGVACGEPERTEAYTTVMLDDYSCPGSVAFLCQYHFDTNEWRGRLGQALQREDSTVSVTGVAEIVVEARDSAAALDKWGKLFGECEPGNCWRWRAGPALRLVAGTQDRIRSLVVELDGSSDGAVRDIEGLGIELRTR